MPGNQHPYRDRPLAIGLMGPLEALVGLQGDFTVLGPIPQPPVGDSHLLIGQEDRAPLLAPADDAGETSGAGVPFSGQGSHLLLEDLGHRL